MSIANIFSQSSKLVGYVIQMDYQCAKILTHDHSISEANYLPQGSFILIKVESSTSEAAILCRVNKINYNNSDAIQNKISSIQRLSSPENPLAQQKGANDVFTQNHISYFELDCKILGTFYERGGELCYGSDAYSFFVSHIYSVYKPNGESLEFISNFVKKDKIEATKELLDKLSPEKDLKKITNIEKQLYFPIGNVRYASTLLEHNEDAEVRIFPSDFIKQKTGIFGMTRTGKSNTVKAIASSIINLSKAINVPIGQIIYDINGEYANDNEQNKKIENSDIYTVDNEVLRETNNKFLPALNNFYQTANYGLKIIQAGLIDKNQDSNYVNNFKSINSIEGNTLSHLLWVLLLYIAGYEIPVNLIKSNPFYYDAAKQEFIWNESIDKINSSPLLTSLKVERSNKEIVVLPVSKINQCIKNLKSQISNSSYFENYTDAQKALVGFITQSDISGEKVRKNLSGWQMILPYKNCHCIYSKSSDYRKEIYEKISTGGTVIIDFSMGDPLIRKIIADELMQYIFDQQVAVFRKDISCPIINVFIEEAHNVIGQKAAIDSLWPRVAKEGAKYNIGVLYATQEPSAIHHNILANTANFIVAHLNNDVEIKTISQFADLADFAYSIKNCEDVGFVRMKLLSKPYTIPVQVRKYDGTS